MHQWIESNITYATELSHKQAYAELFLFETTIVDDIRLMEEFYFPEDYLTGLAPKILSQYNEEFKCMLSTCIDPTLPLTSCKADMRHGGHIVIYSSSACESCGKFICNMCAGILSKNNNGTVLCLDCYCQKLDDSISSLDKIDLLGPVSSQ